MIYLGNAGAAWGAYGARAGIQLVSAMPIDAPPLAVEEMLPPPPPPPFLFIYLVFICYLSEETCALGTFLSLSLFFFDQNPIIAQ
jgi:hypothetical protein